MFVHLRPQVKTNSFIKTGKKWPRGVVAQWCLRQTCAEINGRTYNKSFSQKEPFLTIWRTLYKYKMLAINTLKEKIRPLWISRLACTIVQFGIFGLSKFRWKEHNLWFLKLNCPPWVKAVNSDFDGKTWSK